VEQEETALHQGGVIVILLCGREVLLDVTPQSVTTGHQFAMVAAV